MPVKSIDVGDMPLMRVVDVRRTYPSTDEPVTFCEVTSIPACADCKPAMALSKRAADLTWNFRYTLGCRCMNYKSAYGFTALGEEVISFAD